MLSIIDQSTISIVQVLVLMFGSHGHRQRRVCFSMAMNQWRILNGVIVVTPQQYEFLFQVITSVAQCTPGTQLLLFLDKGHVDTRIVEPFELFTMMSC